MWQIPFRGAQRRFWRAACGLVLASPLMLHATKGLSLERPSLVITNVAQFQQWVGQSQQTNWPVRLKGVVCWSDLAQGMVVLQDDSGTALVEMPPQKQSLRPGERISVDGAYGGSQGGASLTIANLTVNNDCTQGMRERSDEVRLEPGKYPISVSWFDGNHLNGLDVFYEGPGVARQTIPDSDLFHEAINPARGTTNWLPGLNYKAYEGQWTQMPDFQRLTAVKRGITSNFNIGVETRNTGVGLRFNGYLKIQQTGIYRFTLVPHGRQQLFVKQPRLKIISAAFAPKPRSFFPGQILSGQEPAVWAEVEGVVTFISREQSKGLRMELSYEAGNLSVEVADAPLDSAALLPGSRVQMVGICRSADTVNGQRILGAMWTPNMGLIKLLDVSPALWASHPLVSIDSLLSTNFPVGAAPIIHVAGQFYALGPNHSMVIRDGTGKIVLQTRQPPPTSLGTFVEALGRWSPTATNIVLRDGFYREIKHTQQPTELLPVLTTAEQVKQLSRAEALRGYPVQIQGVVTWSGGSGVVLQDSAMGVFVEVVNAQNSGAQHIGEYWQVEGVTTDQFSPMILARHVVRLGTGALPNPIHPTWDQLMNGTLDTEYVEIQGVVTAIKMNCLKLLTHNGTIQVDLPEMQNAELEGYRNALIRIRGCLWAAKNEITHVFIPGEVLIHNASISIERKAPNDPFKAPLKRVSQLLLFDAKASALERIKVEGQIIHYGASEFDLMDGSNALQFITRTNTRLAVGDEVEVVGFPLLGGPVPILREAMARTIGHGPLPAARPLSENALFNVDYDSTLVSVKARLTSLNDEQMEQVLELQTGSHQFVARLNRKQGVLHSVPVGSLLKVTGVYVGRGGDRTLGRAVDSFELLLNSPADIEILAQPSWWTLARLLTMVGILTGFLVIALVWIGLLRRQVEYRTAQLKTEVLARERSEQQHAVEAERSRIARDLHDDLGSSLTEISVLADAGPGWPPTPAKASERFKIIGNKARSVVKALDVIVWLINPSKDFLPFFLSYLGSYAEEYLSPCGIACRVKAPSTVPHLRLTAQVRHNLFLAVKEALHNVVRHARASQVTMEITINGQELKIAITDNGQGFNPEEPAGGNGLVNFNNRLANVGGQCQIASSAEAGTVVTFILPLTANQNS